MESRLRSISTAFFFKRFIEACHSPLLRLSDRPNIAATEVSQIVVCGDIECRAFVMGSS